MKLGCRRWTYLTVILWRFWLWLILYARIVLGIAHLYLILLLKHATVHIYFKYICSFWCYLAKLFLGHNEIVFNWCWSFDRWTLYIQWVESLKSVRRFNLSSLEVRTLNTDCLKISHMKTERKSKLILEKSPSSWKMPSNATFACIGQWQCFMVTVLLWFLNNQFCVFSPN